MLEVEYHNHDGVNSPKVRESDLENAIDKTTVVLNTTDQTIAGVKTFSSIPILPSTTPTDDNQAVRKGYLDGKIGTFVVNASDSLVDSANTEQSFFDTSYTKYKDITFNEISGTVRVKFDLKNNNGAGTSYAKVYKNGVAVGTERHEGAAVYTTFTEDFSISTGDEIQLYCRTVTTYGLIRNFRLYYTKSPTPTPGTVNLS